MDKIKVLIVEDEPMIALEISEVMTHLGNQVLAIVDSGEEAIEKARQVNPDIILMDIRLTGEMDGIEAAGIINTRFNIPVVFLTAHAEQEYLDKAKLAQPYGYLIKPVQERDLKVTIEMALYTAKIEAERRAAELELSKSKQQYQDLVQSANTIILKMDTEGRITFFNTYAQTFFGYEENEVLGKNVADVFLPKTESTGRDLDRMIRNILENPDSFAVNENETVLRNGDRVWVSWANKGLKDDKGNLVEMLSMGHDITARKQYEAALALSEERLSLAQKSADMGSWEWNIETDCIEGSESIETIFGLTDGTFTRSKATFLKYVHPDDKDFVVESVDKALKGKKDLDIEHRIIRPDGSIRWIQEIGKVYRNEAGNAVRMLGIVQDITTRKSFQDKLENRTSMLQAVLDSVQESACLIDQDGTVLYSNQTFADRYEQPMEKMIGRNLYDFMPRDLAQSRQRVVSHVIRTGESTRFTDKRDPFHFENFVYPVFSPTGDKLGAAVLSVEITERINNELNLQKLWMAIEQSPLSIVITDAQGTIEYINPGFCSVTGYSAEDVIGENPKLLKSNLHDKTFYTDLWTTISSGQIWKGEIFNRKKNGDFFWEQASIAPVFNNEGKITHYIGIKEDITRRKELENYKNDIEELMRHDLKSPLTAIFGYPQILLKTELNDRQRQFVQNITQAGNMMLQIIDSYLHISKIEAGTFELTAVHFDLTSVIKQVIGDLKPSTVSKQVEIDLVTGSKFTENGDTLFVNGDETLCYSIFSNLLKNAIEASPDKEKVQISLTSKSPSVEIEIMNKGTVPIEIREQFFKKYISSGKVKGTGFGTYSAKLMTESQGGAISMQTSEERGTRITVTLPG